MEESRGREVSGLRKEDENIVVEDLSIIEKVLKGICEKKPESCLLKYFNEST